MLLKCFQRLFHFKITFKITDATTLSKLHVEPKLCSLSGFTVRKGKHTGLCGVLPHCRNQSKDFGYSGNLARDILQGQFLSKLAMAFADFSNMQFSFGRIQSTQGWTTKEMALVFHSKNGIVCPMVQQNDLPIPGVDMDEQMKAKGAVKNCEQTRVSRLFRMVQVIRDDPRQSLESLCQHFGISRSQFYKDRSALANIGFNCEYRKAAGFRILEDRLTPITGLSLSDRLILMFALENLHATAEGLLAARAVEVGRKLAGGLESPFREQLTACFEQEVMHQAFGVQPEILSLVREAITEGRRIRLLYERSEDWTTRWREVDPKRIYLRQRTLYLYARTADENPPQWKVFRMGRIRQVQLTGMCIACRPEDTDGFVERQKNAFMAFIGTESLRVRIRFTGNARHFVRERCWHSSQQLEEDRNGGLLFSVAVAEPQEVIRWARQFGDEAEILEVETLEQRNKIQDEV